jgi:hypothetical protein
MAQAQQQTVPTHTLPIWRLFFEIHGRLWLRFAGKPFSSSSASHFINVSNSATRQRKEIDLRIPGEDEADVRRLGLLGRGIVFQAVDFGAEVQGISF